MYNLTDSVDLNKRSKNNVSNIIIARHKVTPYIIYIFRFTFEPLNRDISAQALRQFKFTYPYSNMW